MLTVNINQIKHFRFLKYFIHTVGDLSYLILKKISANISRQLPALGSDRKPPDYKAIPLTIRPHQKELFCIGLSVNSYYTTVIESN